MVERHLAKVEVAGSSPVIRSKTKNHTRSGVVFCFGPVLRSCAARSGAKPQAKLHEAVLPMQVFRLRNTWQRKSSPKKISSLITLPPRKGASYKEVCKLNCRDRRSYAVRSRSGSDTAPWCHSRPSRRFASRCGSVTLGEKQHSVVFLHPRAASLPRLSEKTKV